MSGAIVVLNGGSSSLKFSLFVEHEGELRADLHGQAEGLFTHPRLVARAADGTVLAEKDWGAGAALGHDGALQQLFELLRTRPASARVIGIGHRVVHGGAMFDRPLKVDAEVLAALRRFEPLAPLHQPYNLAPIAALMAQAPQLPQVACFDTAFHSGHTPLAQMFGLPYDMFEQGVRRYGFHGLSYEYIASVLPQTDARAAAGRTVVMHLGNGASLCALHAGRSVASTMGFTAVDGLLMGTRCGSLDPGVVLYLMKERGLDATAVEQLLYSRSGLLGVSGVSSDMRTLLASSEPRARLAIELYVYRIRRELGSMAAALGGLDSLVFTGGIGENAATVRAAVCEGARWLGVELDAAANDAASGPGPSRISTAASRVGVWRMATNEERMIAQHTRRIVEG
jgi:acetate kinase